MASGVIKGIICWTFCCHFILQHQSQWKALIQLAVGSGWSPSGALWLKLFCTWDTLQIQFSQKDFSANLEELPLPPSSMNLPHVQLCTVFHSVYFSLSTYFLSSKLSHHSNENISDFFFFYCTNSFESSASAAHCLRKIFPSFNAVVASPGPVLITHKLAEMKGWSAWYFENQYCSSSVPVPWCAGQRAGCQNPPNFLQMLCETAHLPRARQGQALGCWQLSDASFLALVSLAVPSEEAGR